MTTVALGEVVDFHSGGTPSKANPDFWRGDVPWFSAKDIKQARLTDSADHISQSVFDSTSIRKIPAGTVTMVVRGMILAHTVPIAILDVESAINQDLKALIPRREIDPRFLAAMLRAQHDVILAQVSTAAHGTKKLDARVLESIRIPLPPLDEQRRIAAILDQADALRAKRRKALAHLDELPLAIFLEMFGSPDEVVDRVPFGEVARLSGGRNLVAADAGLQSPYRVLKISAVTTGHFKPHESKPLPADYVPPASHLVRRGDLLMSRANTTELVGAVALVHDAPGNLALPDKVWKFEWRVPDSVPAFYHVLFRMPSVRRQISRLSSGTGGSMKNVSKGKLETMLIPDVSTAHQEQFAKRVDCLSSLRAAAQRAIRAEEELFASLQFEAFRGNL
ncbi:restriction endonuclease subunit S [Nocardioides sp. zg-DK7169]|uniref:restriction endonuclease subunit S n=1 Tax=Nocardioides sp. zg-DK7169 TaxID=2736600 RepID=UPI0015545EBD|nr:restriction endonuclease subunit S [Nocardioides sp. zg-DK7169]NPC97854.1 hypothetical protein [Nocardioides sp. zg-DK7169]